MQIVFRTDASLDIGNGHVMRCLAVAQILRDRGAKCHFLCRELAGNLIHSIEAMGFPVGILPFPADQGGDNGSRGQQSDSVPHEAWLATGWTEDSAQSIAAIEALLPGVISDWLVIDHYALDARWEQAMSGMCRHILVIDDLADRQHRCDLLLDQNIGRTRADYAARVNPECHLMTGTKHALLRPEFSALRQKSLTRRAEHPVRKLLISLGGVDKDNATGAVLDGVGHCDLPSELEIVVVMGEHAPWLESVRGQVARLPWKASVATRVGDMATLMADADIAIGAAGTTTWERCCLGLPSLVIGTAENQRYVLSQLASRCVAVIGGLQHLKEDPRRLRPLMKQLVDERESYSQRSAELTEGNGCKILADYMFSG